MNRQYWDFEDMDYGYYQQKEMDYEYYQEKYEELTWLRTELAWFYEDYRQADEEMTHYLKDV